MALLAGGGYAERVAVPVGQLMPVPRGVDLVTGGGAARGRVHGVVQRRACSRGCGRGETLLVHGGGGGIGTFAIQAGAALGARVAVTAGSAEKLDRCASWAPRSW